MIRGKTIRRFAQVATSLFLTTSVCWGCPDPGDYQVAIYKDANFSGACTVLNVGAYPTSASTGLPNDSISSIKVGARVRAVLFQNDYYGGNSSLYESGTYSIVGRNENDQTTSMLVRYSWGKRAAFQWLGNNPHGMGGGWATEVQGLAHSEQSWFITTRDMIWGYDIGDDLNINANLPVQLAGMPGVLSAIGCNHFGDAEFDVAHDVLFVPIEGCSGGPVLGVFDPNLNLICYDQLYLQSSAPWLTIDPSTGHLVSNGGRINQSNPINTYTIDWNAIYSDPNPHWIIYDAGPHYLYHDDGTAVDINTAQGADFSDDGGLFYLASGYSECGTDWNGADQGGLRVFDMVNSDGYLIAKAGNDYGLFNYENHCGWSSYEEAEGLDHVNMNVRPGPYYGQLHVLLLSNGLGGDKIYLKHYSQ